VTAALVGPLDQVQAAMDALGPVARLQFAQATLAAVRDESTPPAARAVWVALCGLTMGTDETRLAALVAALRDGGPGVPLVVAAVAGENAAHDEPRAAVWLSLRDLAWAVGS